MTASGALRFGGSDLFRQALLAKMQRFEKAQEFRAQHGEVKIIMKDGKLL